MDTITLTINGQELEVEPGMTVLEAARNADIYIPGLCYYPDLRPLPEVTPDMACQLCLVEIDGSIVLEDGRHLVIQDKLKSEEMKTELSIICGTCNTVITFDPILVILEPKITDINCPICSNVLELCIQ